MLRTGQLSGVTVKDTTLINKSQKRRRLPKGRLEFRRSVVSGLASPRKTHACFHVISTRRQH